MLTVFRRERTIRNTTADTAAPAMITNDTVPAVKSKGMNVGPSADDAAAAMMAPQ